MTAALYFGTKFLAAVVYSVFSILKTDQYHITVWRHYKELSVQSVQTTKNEGTK